MLSYKKAAAPQILLAQEEEIGRLMARFQGQTPSGQLVQELEVLLRAAVFKPAGSPVGCLLQGAADRIDADCQAKAGEHFKGRETLRVQGLFGVFSIQRDDYYHALDPAGKVLEVLLGKNHPDFPKQRRRWAKRRLKDQVAALIEETRQAAAGTPPSRAVAAALGYFERNAARMKQGTFRKNGWFIGSGVVEAGGKTVIGARCKQSGMFRPKPGDQNILALRCIHSSRNRDAFWKHRLNQHAKQNDSIALSAC